MNATTAAHNKFFASSKFFLACEILNIMERDSVNKEIALSRFTRFQAAVSGGRPTVLTMLSDPQRDQLLAEVDRVIAVRADLAAARIARQAKAAAPVAPATYRHYTRPARQYWESGYVNPDPKSGDW